MFSFNSYTALATLLWFVSWNATALAAEPYTIYKKWADVEESKDALYPKLVRVSEPGTIEKPSYTGFWFFGIQQFDPTNRYALAMKVDFQNRNVKETDHGEIGYFDLKDGNRWTKIGETTAWNWQQGCRLMWRPNSDEILWNDRAPDNSHFICQAYNFKTGKRRTLPRPIYDVSPDGKTALTHDFQRMIHAGTNYVGIPDPYEKENAPAETGVWSMDMETGEATLLVSLAKMAELAKSKGGTWKSNLYIFREGWNPSGSRFMVFLKGDKMTQAWTMSKTGSDIRLCFSTFTLPSRGLVTRIRKTKKIPSRGGWEFWKFVVGFDSRLSGRSWCNRRRHIHPRHNRRHRNRNCCSRCIRGKGC